MDQEPRSRVEQQIPRQRAAVVWGCTKRRTPADRPVIGVKSRASCSSAPTPPEPQEDPDDHDHTTGPPSPTTEERCPGFGEADGVRWDLPGTAANVQHRRRRQAQVRGSGLAADPAATRRVASGRARSRPAGRPSGM